MFVFDVRFMIEQFKKLVPDIYNLLIQLPNIYDDKYKLILNKLYPECEPISVDYAIMEKSQDIYVIPSEFGWDDVGSWEALERYMKIDLIDHQAQGEKYDSDNSKILDNFSESIGNDFVMYFGIFSIICVFVYL